MTTHYLGLKSTDKPELAGAEFTADIEHDGNYSVELQNVSDMQDKQSYWFDGINDVISFSAITLDVASASLIVEYKRSELSNSEALIGNSTTTTKSLVTTHATSIYIESNTGSNTVSISYDSSLKNTILSIVILSSSPTFYVNGKEYTSSGGPFSDDITFDQLGLLGPNTSPYLGHISRLQLFNIPLSELEVKQFSSGSSIPYKYIKASQTALTSGTLTIGKQYIIDTYVSDDDFTNVGGTNVTGNEFVATGTTPTKWLSSSSLRQIGCILNLQPENIGHNQWLDSSGNNFHGTVSGAIPINLPTNHVEKYVDLTVTGDTTFTLPIGYKITSIIAHETNSAAAGNLTVGYSIDAEEVVAAVALGADALLNCTLVSTGVLGAGFPDAADTIHICSSTDFGAGNAEMRITMEKINS